MMFESDGTEFEPFDTEDEELVRRLRELEWPGVNPEVRERCWEDFKLRQSRAGSEDAGSTGDEGDEGDDGKRPRRNISRRESYTRRVPLARDPLNGYARAPRRWQERPAPTFAGSLR
jgi:hypothetical protein